MLGAAGDRHLAEFFPHFLTEASEWGRRYGVELTTMEHRMQGRQRRSDHIRAIVKERRSCRRCSAAPNSCPALPLP